MKIALGCDHIVTDIKIEISDFLKSLGHEVLDVGTYDFTRVHYPVFGKEVAELVGSSEADLGVTICGTGVGITASAVKNEKARAVLVRDVTTAKYAKEAFNANIIGFGGMIVGKNLAKEIVETFINTPYDATPEKEALIAKIHGIEASDATQRLNKEFFKEELDKWDAGFYVD